MKVFPLALLLATGCYPSTTRPEFVPQPEATRHEVEMSVPQATRALALALNADSFPVIRTEPTDGWLETGWFNGVSMRPVAERRLGLGIVKLMAIVEPGRANHSVITVEIFYRPLANPSMPERELEMVVKPSHPVMARLTNALESLSP